MVLRPWSSKQLLPRVLRPVYLVLFTCSPLFHSTQCAVSYNDKVSDNNPNKELLDSVLFVRFSVDPDILPSTQQSGRLSQGPVAQRAIIVCPYLASNSQESRAAMQRRYLNVLLQLAPVTYSSHTQCGDSTGPGTSRGGDNFAKSQRPT